jgi:hypothetical protein
MNEEHFDLNDFVEKEPNIWACIYRSINRMKDNNQYDEENDNSREILARSFKNSSFVAFKDFGFSRGLTDDQQKLENLKDKIIKPMPEFLKIVEDDEYNLAEDSNTNTKNTVHNSDFNSRISQGVFSSENSKDSFHKQRSKTTSKFQNTLSATQFNTRFNLKMNRSVSEQFKVEEFLVIYYVSIVIRLSKLQDGMKAINEYNKKKSLSSLACAHISKVLGVLSMLSEDKKYQEAKEHFNKSISHFKKIKSPIGLTISRLALIRCECEIEFRRISKPEVLHQLIKSTKECKKAFRSYNHKLGEDRAQLYINCLINKLSGQDIGNFKKTLRSTTLKSKGFIQTRNKESLLISNMLQDEDIKLFLEVHKPDSSGTPNRVLSNEEIDNYRTPQISSNKQEEFDDHRIRSEDSTKNRHNQV